MKSRRNNQLQCVLFQAAKVGNITPMREFIEKRVDSFALDRDIKTHFYAQQQALEEITVLLNNRNYNN